MRGRLSGIAAALLFCGSAFAMDGGRTVTFGLVSGISFSVSAKGESARVVYDSGLSDPLPDAWDTLLIQGESPDPGVSFEAARVNGATWEKLEIQRFPGGRFWARARMPRASGPLRLRALAEGARVNHTVVVYEVGVLGSELAGEDSPPVPPRGPVNLNAPRPFVHGRAEWNAVPPTQPWEPDPLPWRVTLHHTAGRHTTTLAESEEEARFIQNFHIHGQGWIDIGYHFLVDAQGDILEGRPEGTLGAHTLSNNPGNVGIALLGNYHPPVNDVPTKAQLDAVAALGRYLVARYGIDPKSLKGHRDYNDTECPGNILYAKLDALRLAFGGLPLPPAFAKPANRPEIPLARLGEPAFDGATALP